VAWVVSLVSPPVLPVHRLWFERMGHRIDVDRVLDEAVSVLERQGPLTRHELAERLGRPGEGGLAAALARLGSLQGLVVCGPERGAEPTYVGVERWLGRALARRRVSDPLAELGRRYLRGHMPASPADFAAWSGLGQRAARAAFASVSDELVKEDQPPAAGRFVRLLPRWDSVLLGWKGREWLVPPAYSSRVLPGGGYLHAVVLVDGRAAGTWRLERQQLRVDWFGAEPRGVRRALAAEEADLRRFLGRGCS
jgi:Winged helix DNA-binding domain